MTPQIEISINGRSLGEVDKRITGGSLVESDGERADELRFTVSNYDGRLKKPSRGETVSASVGWKETGVVKAGEFVVASTLKRGPAAVFEITAHSADLKKTLKAQKTRSWTKGKALGDVVAQVAGDNGLTPAIDQALAQTPIEAIVAQTAESDMHLLTRLAREYGALFKIASGRLLFVPRGAGTTASGAAAASCTITPNDCLEFQIVDQDRPARGKAKAAFYDRSKATRTTIESDKSGAAGAPDFTLPQTFGSRTAAQKACDARQSGFARAGKTFSATLRQGFVAVAPGGAPTTQGFGDDDDQTWIVKQRAFEFGHGGLSIKIACETKGA